MKDPPPLISSTKCSSFSCWSSLGTPFSSFFLLKVFLFPFSDRVLSLFFFFFSGLPPPSSRLAGFGVLFPPPPVAPLFSRTATEMGRPLTFVFVISPPFPGSFPIICQVSLPPPSILFSPFPHVDYTVILLSVPPLR